MRIVHLLYQIGGVIFCDVFLKGEILEDGENGENAQNDAITTILKVDPNLKKKFYVLAFESKRKCYKPGNRIMRRRKMAEAYAKVLFPLDHYEPSKKTKDRIKKLILDETYKASKKRIIVDSSDGSDEELNSNVNKREDDEKHNMTPTSKISPLGNVRSESGGTSPSPGTLMPEKLKENSTNSSEGREPKELVVSDDNEAILKEMCVQNSVPHLEEAITNIKMLLSINYIQMGNFYVKGDKVILKHPFVHAYGDFITGRHMFHHYKRDGYQERITRLTHSDLVC
jgi:hypothetical protein